MRLAGRQAAEPRRQRRLPAAPLQRVLDYLNDNLAEAVALADLAAVARVSVFHFARQFRAAVGEAPHRYVIRLRVERAKAAASARGGSRWPRSRPPSGSPTRATSTGTSSGSTGVTPRQFLRGGE